MKSEIVVVENNVLNIDGFDYGFFHDKDGKNYFTASVIADMLNTTIGNVNWHLRKYASFVSNTNKWLKKGGYNNRTKYYDFSTIVWLSARVNTKEAIQIVRLAGDLLNEKFNNEVFGDNLLEAKESVEKSLLNYIDKLEKEERAVVKYIADLEDNGNYPRAGDERKYLFDICSEKSKAFGYLEKAQTSADFNDSMKFGLQTRLVI